MIAGYILLLIAALLSAAPPLLVQKYVNGGSKNFMPLAISLAVSVALLIIYIYLCKNYGASRMYAGVKILSVVLVVIIGVLFLGDKLTIKTVIGILLGIVALILITSK